jgi:hypothetical protein
MSGITGWNIRFCSSDEIAAGYESLYANGDGCKEQEVVHSSFSKYNKNRFTWMVSAKQVRLIQVLEVNLTKK